MPRGGCEGLWPTHVVPPPGSSPVTLRGDSFCAASPPRRLEPLVPTRSFLGSRRAAEVGELVAYLLIAPLALYERNSFIAISGIIILATIAAGLLTGRYLVKQRVRNAVLITILSTSFAVLMPVVGALIGFPLLTGLLGKDRQD